MYLLHTQQPVKKAKKAGTKKAKGKKKGKTKGKGKGKSKTVTDKSPPPVADPLSHAAMLNAYYISHGPVQFLEFRGYSWAGATTGKKKKKGGKKKK